MARSSEITTGRGCVDGDFELTIWVRVFPSELEASRRLQEDGEYLGALLSRTDQESLRRVLGEVPPGPEPSPELHSLSYDDFYELQRSKFLDDYGELNPTYSFSGDVRKGRVIFTVEAVDSHPGFWYGPYGPEVSVCYRCKKEARRLMRELIVRWDSYAPD